MTLISEVDEVKGSYEEGKVRRGGEDQQGGLGSMIATCEDMAATQGFFPVKKHHTSTKE